MKEIIFFKKLIKVFFYTINKKRREISILKSSNWRWIAVEEGVSLQFPE
jgi:hypothetical protein